MLFLGKLGRQGSTEILEDASVYSMYSGCIFLLLLFCDLKRPTQIYFNCSVWTNVLIWCVFTGLARCISLSSLGLFVYNELLNESLHAKIKEAIQVKIVFGTQNLVKLLLFFQWYILIPLRLITSMCAFTFYWRKFRCGDWFSLLTISSCSTHNVVCVCIREKYTDFIG